MNKIYHLSQMQQWREGKKQIKIKIQNDCVIINDLGFFIYKRTRNVFVPDIEDSDDNLDFQYVLKVRRKYKKLMFVTKTGDKRLKGNLYLRYE